MYNSLKREFILKKSITPQKLQILATKLPGYLFGGFAYYPVKRFDDYLVGRPNFKQLCMRHIFFFSISPIFSQTMERDWRTLWPGDKLQLRSQPKGNNVKLTEEHLEFLNKYLEEYTAFIIKVTTVSLCASFYGLIISDSAVHRHATENLVFTLTRTLARVAERNSESTIEQCRQFIVHIFENKVDFKNKCIFVNESGFKKYMVRPVA